MAKKNGHKAAWWTEGHRPHKYEDVHLCHVDAHRHSEEHPRTLVYVETWVERLQAYRIVVALKNGLSDPLATRDARKGRESNGGSYERADQGVSEGGGD